MAGKTFKCRRCRTPIDGHNQYLHDGMCDQCFSKTYFPEEDPYRLKHKRGKKPKDRKPTRETKITYFQPRL
jgi:NMD protein affecting ribosome stability and mRNA decay